MADRGGDKEKAKALVVASRVKEIVEHPGSFKAFNPGHRSGIQNRI